ncbi:hypothetical protein GOP47_0011799 [Adiantum capillus-veneris]|uniref:tRNA-uridine aminocarboxypropyltransferase n=1 Tax=Adiantum capillus-veneris TaxID=13818 RepID=A0A9D4UTY0_ADICA|nr:hypothetical protein GOP47_0011799 [Adiantum capillus-veneris]
MLGRRWSVPCGLSLPTTVAGRSNLPYRRTTGKLRLKAMVVHNPIAGEAAPVEDFSGAWHDFGRSPPDIPPLVKRLILEVKSLEVELGEKLVFGGPRGSLQGRAKAAEDHRHRAFYGYMPDREEKLQFYSARQVACRVLGCKGYLCKDCWLPLTDCMCAKVERVSLWSGVQLWLYMHPKDFLRKNNSGKLLWQVFGGESAHLCVCGIEEQEEAMWDALKQAGQGSVWYLYPEQGVSNTQVNELVLPKELAHTGVPRDKCKTSLNFILIDGTWSNSKMMVNRLQSRARGTWQDCMQSLSLSVDKHSVLHNLRPQPSLDRTCTAAAVVQLLRELDLREDLVGCQLEKAADALDEALQRLLEVLTTRRERKGRGLGKH